MRYLLIARVAMLAGLCSPALGADEFSLRGIRLGMDASEAQLHLEELCANRCRSYTQAGPAGITKLTSYLRYQTVYFSNTGRAEVDTSQPYEQVTLTLHPNRKVIALQGQAYGSPEAAHAFAETMSGLYPGTLQTFTEQKNNVLVTTQADSTTTHSISLYEPFLQGRKFQVTSWSTSTSRALTRMDYIDFDAMNKLATENPEDFAYARNRAGLTTQPDGIAGLKPRLASSLEASRAPAYSAVTTGALTKLVDGPNTLEVVAERALSTSWPSQILLNGQAIATSRLREDRMTFVSVQKLSTDLYRIHNEGDGSGCGVQQQLVLRIVDGHGYLSEPFGRCSPSISEHGGVTYFSFPATEYESAMVLAIP
ncbi:hypothetical protein ACIUZJ_03070 [Pseudomonas aeruginosa]